VFSSTHSPRISRLLEARRDPHLHHLARRIHALGPRPLCELFAELEADGVPRVFFERYARLPREFIKALDGDELPPLHEV
jgi:hypothetical protein